MKFTYLYFMKDKPDRVRAVAPDHAAYWRGLALPGYQGGPFMDRSGGLITFDHDSEQDAQRFTTNDPFRREDLLEVHWVKVWAVE
jgi:uncharacterized protein YciI